MWNRSVRARMNEDQLSRINPIVRADGPYVEFVKGTDQRSGRPVDLAFDHTGRQIDGAALLAKLAAARAKRRGKYDEALYRRLATGRGSAAHQSSGMAAFGRTPAAQDDEGLRPGDKELLNVVQRNRTAMADTVKRFLATETGSLLREAERAAHAPFSSLESRKQNCANCMTTST